MRKSILIFFCVCELICHSRYASYFLDNIRSNFNARQNAFDFCTTTEYDLRTNCNHLIPKRCDSIFKTEFLLLKRIPILQRCKCQNCAYHGFYVSLIHEPYDTYTHTYMRVFLFSLLISLNTLDMASCGSILQAVFLYVK